MPCFNDGYGHDAFISIQVHGKPYSRNTGNSSFQNLHLSFSLLLPTLVLRGAVFRTKYFHEGVSYFGHDAKDGTELGFLKNEDRSIMEEIFEN